MNRVLAFLALVALAACAGDGAGLDANGNPAGTGGAASPGGGGPSGGSPGALGKLLQDTVFTPVCGECHEGAKAPLGLKLAPDAYQTLFVEARDSQELPSMKEVRPGNPDASYLVWKIEGRNVIEGEPMPLGKPRLPQATIEQIRQWIAGTPAPAVLIYGPPEWADR